MEGMSSQISDNECPGFTPFGVSRKRKDRDRPDAHEPHMATKAEPTTPAQPQAPPQQPAGASGNRLLAGYLAHEFLTRGTLFGERWDPAAPANSRPPPSQSKEPVAQRQKQPAPAAEAEPGKPPRAYAEVAHLLKTDGAHVPGVVNPTQLAQWLQM